MPQKKIRQPATRKSAGNKVLLTINGFGPFLRDSDIKRLRTDSDDALLAHLAHALELFFDRPLSMIKDRDLKRYTEITTQETHSTFAPAYKRVVDRIVEPLLAAKRHYCIGEYLSCVAVSGIICEMLTMLLWKMGTITIGGKQVTKQDEEKLFGKTFEKIGQKRRLDVLITIKTINDDLYKKFEHVRNTRNKYLHAWEFDTRQKKGDARRLIITTLLLFKSVVDMRLVVDKEGKQRVTINPKLLKFLHESDSGR